MFKEIFLAIILGTLLGFGLTGGYFAIKKNVSQPSTSTSVTPTLAAQISSNPTITPSPAIVDTNNQLIISSPENEALVSNSKITLKGSASPKSTIIITTDTKNYHTTADSSGKFSLEIEIETGSNLIQVDAIDTNDNQSSSQIIVTYSTAKI